MLLNKTDILKAIDDMVIYKKDYDIIVQLLDYLDEKTFTKILEDVIAGDLYWSDFEKILANTNYPTMLQETIETQAKINRKLKLLTEYRRSINENYEYDAATNQYVFVNSYSKETDSDLTQFYDDEFKNIQADMLYELSKITADDNELSIACKMRLYNAIKNGDVLILNNSQVSNGVLTLNGQTYTVTDTTITNTATKESFEYINKNDIMLFLNTYSIPIYGIDQTLTEFDKQYMEQNNLTEQETKHFKALSFIMRRNMFLNKNESEEADNEQDNND